MQLFLFFSFAKFAVHSLVLLCFRFPSATLLIPGLYCNGPSFDRVIGSLQQLGISEIRFNLNNGVPPTRKPTFKPCPILAIVQNPLSTMAPLRTKSQLWFAAIKPPMYTVAITPILCGSLSFYADKLIISMSTMSTFLLAAIFIIAWLNLTNDVFDFDTGVDEHKSESIVNLCGASRKSRNFILCIALLFLSFGIYLLNSLCTNDYTLLCIMLLAVFLGYAYQSPPFRLSYLGLGEPITFIAWTLTVCSAYYSQLISTSTSTSNQIININNMTLPQKVLYVFFSSDMLLSKNSYLFSTSFLVALPTTIILFCSHFHQEDDDRKAGKLSPIVRLGVSKASKLLWFLLILFISIPFPFYFYGLLPFQVLILISLTIPISLKLAMFVQKYHKQPSVVFVAKYMAVKLHFIHGILMCIGFFIAGREVLLSSA